MPVAKVTSIQAGTRRALEAKINKLLEEDARWTLVTVHKEGLDYIAWLQWDMGEPCFS